MRTLLAAAALAALAVLPACSVESGPVPATPPIQPIGTPELSVATLQPVATVPTPDALATLTEDERGKLEVYAKMARSFVLNGTVDPAAVTPAALVADAQLNYGIHLTTAQAEVLRDRILQP